MVKTVSVCDGPKGRRAGSLDHVHHYWQVFGPLFRTPKKGVQKGVEKWSFWVVPGRDRGVSGRDRREISSRIGTTLDPWNQGSWQHQDP